MTLAAMIATPKHRAYDGVIVGGAIMGSSAAWFLSANPDFQGRVLVVERDPNYAQAASALSASARNSLLELSCTVATTWVELLSTSIRLFRSRPYGSDIS